MTNEGFLLHNIDKVRYFPRNYFFGAKLGTNPSWRGTWELKDFLMQGCWWRIRDGKLVRIGNNPWISRVPRAEYLRQPNKLVDEVNDLKVNSLISSDRRWDIEKLTEFFPSEVVAKILKLSLSPNKHVVKRL